MEPQDLDETGNPLQSVKTVRLVKHTGHCSPRYGHNLPQITISMILKTEAIFRNYIENRDCLFCQCAHLITCCSDVTVDDMTSDMFCLVVPERVIRKSTIGASDKSERPELEKIRFELRIDRAKNMIT